MPIPRAFVLGHPVAHSRSPMIHGHWLRTLGLPGAYDRQDVAPAGLPAFFAGMAARGYVGGNVTVPHKVAAMGFMSRVDAAAEAVGAVNTIWTERGTLVGGNTDASGFLANLDERAPGWDAAASATVLGAGGAARAVVHGLLGRGLEVRLVNRTAAAAHALAAHFGPRVRVHEHGPLPRAGLLVNTTSLGMAGQPPLAIGLGCLLLPEAVVCDIVYVPLETALLRDAAALGHRTVDGLGMLLHQARAGFAHWFGVMPDVTGELRALVVADLPA